MFAGKTLLSPFPVAFLRLLFSFFPLPPPFVPFFFPFFFSKLFFPPSSSLVRSFPTVETSLPWLDYGAFFLSARRGFSTLRVVARSSSKQPRVKPTYALFQLFPLEILDESLIDLLSPSILLFFSFIREYSRSRNFSFARENAVSSFSFCITSNRRVRNEEEDRSME